MVDPERRLPDHDCTPVQSLRFGVLTLDEMGRLVCGRGELETYDMSQTCEIDVSRRGDGSRLLLLQLNLGANTRKK